MTELRRCAWAQSDPLLQQYHDTEWAVPQFDSRTLWETLMLEGFQAGLSWVVILRKREAFRQAFQRFDPEAVARFDRQDMERLLADSGIVRSRAKIEATIAGAKIYLGMRDKGEEFSPFLWSFVHGRPLVRLSRESIVQNVESEQLSAALKKRGFKFVGPVIVYAFMQAVGMINDHAPECFKRNPI